MNDLQLGLGLRAARMKRRMRQADLAAQAGVSASIVSRFEHGEFDCSALGVIRRVAGKLGVVLEIAPKSRGGEFERVINARHAIFGEAVAAWVARRPGWIVAAEVSFSIYGERGIVDLLAWHEATGSLVVIELKTAIVDVDELIGTLDRKRRLAPRIAALRGWRAGPVSTWLLVADSKTNRRRVAEHRTMLTSGLPLDGRSLGSLFTRPERGAQSGIAFWSNVSVGKVSHPTAAPDRVLATRRHCTLPRPRSEQGRAGGQSTLRGPIVADSPATGSPVSSNSPDRRV